MTTSGIRQDVLWSYGAQTVQAVLSFGLSIFLARLDRSGALLGSYALAVGIGAPVFVFWGLQLKAILATDAKGEFAFSEYLGARLACIAAALLCICGYSAVFVRDPLVGKLLLAISLWRSVDLVGDIFQGYLQRNGAVARMSQAIIFRSVATSTAIAVGFFAHFSAAVVFLFAGASSALALAMVDVRLAAAIRSRLPFSSSTQGSFAPSFSPRVLKTLFVRALPTGFTAVLGSIHGQLPLYLIGAFHGTSVLGHFSAVYTPVVAAQVFMAAPIDGVLARLAESIAARDTRETRSLVRRLAQIASLLSGLVIVGGFTIGPTLVPIFFGPSYSGGGWVLRLLCLGAAANFFAAALGGVLMAARTYSLILALSIAGFAMSGLANWMLITRFAALGASGAFALTAVLSIALQILPAYRLWRRQAGPVLILPQ